ncbi:hypothetical protein P280DRAFT_510274 [Massarina eburnea CBS 473.64]|uniref:DUF7730 domain-containing protein n=1 Tax=Massarina eburnea CBS 473.64 TaxID=1395130 RepID=A0A6A6RQA6_9PLEO|nr:hypothetical protein P280DRAFT_510274 [Massarina eburnea CBS 473.64]
MATMSLSSKIARKRPLDDTNTAESYQQTKKEAKTTISMEAITRRNQLESPLLRLPAEIRSIVYEYTLGGYIFDYDDPIDGSNNFYRQKNESRSARFFFDRSSWNEQISKVNGLSSTCRQINAETRSLIFSLNIFTIEWTCCTGMMLNCLPLGAMDTIQTVELLGSRVQSMPPFIAGGRPKECDEDYRRGWGRMKGLRKVIVMINDHRVKDDPLRFEEWKMKAIETVKCITRHNDLEIVFED